MMPSENQGYPIAPDKWGAFGYDPVEKRPRRIKGGIFELNGIHLTRLLLDEGYKEDGREEFDLHVHDVDPIDCDINGVPKRFNLVINRAKAVETPVYPEETMVELQVAEDPEDGIITEATIVRSKEGKPHYVIKIDKKTLRSLGRDNIYDTDGNDSGDNTSKNKKV